MGKLTKPELEHFNAAVRLRCMQCRKDGEAPRDYCQTGCPLGQVIAMCEAKTGSPGKAMDYIARDNLTRAWGGRVQLAIHGNQMGKAAQCE